MAKSPQSNFMPLIFHAQVSATKMRATQNLVSIIIQDFTGTAYREVNLGWGKYLVSPFLIQTTNKWEGGSVGGRPKTRGAKQEIVHGRVSEMAMRRNANGNVDAMPCLISLPPSSYIFSLSQRLFIVLFPFRVR